MTRTLVSLKMGNISNDDAVTINYGYIRVYARGTVRAALLESRPLRERQMRSVSDADRYYECPPRRKPVDYVPLNYYGVIEKRTF